MIQAFHGQLPRLHPQARAADNATFVGNVTVEEGASVWYGAVLRGDQASISIGANSNIQDAAVVHCAPNYPTSVGRNVTVGHGCIIHGCTVEDTCLIGMGAILMNGCVIGAGSLVGAGALVTQNTVVPPGSLVVGAPAKVIRPLRPDEAEGLLQSASGYQKLAEAQLPLCGDGAAEGAK